MSQSTCALLAQILPVFLLIIAIPNGAATEAIKVARDTPIMLGPALGLRVLIGWLQDWRAGRLMLLAFVAGEALLVVGAGRAEGLAGSDGWEVAGTFAWLVSIAVGLFAALDLGATAFPRPDAESEAPTPRS